MSSELTTAPLLEQVARIEAHCVHSWPPALVKHTDDGWILRATPGVPSRGRSNHALPPARRLDPAGFDAAIARVGEFAKRHGIDAGIQVGPTSVHTPLLEELVRRGWQVRPGVLVMTADTQVIAADADSGLTLEVNDYATPDWVAAWRHCDGRPDVDAHVRHVFPRMAGSANFVHSGDCAVGISVQFAGIVGLYCLAVAPELRRRGLGKALVKGMLEQHDASLTYLQVFSENAAGVALYDSLGFQEAYRYRHAFTALAR